MKLNKLLIAVLIAAFGAVGVFAQEDKPVKVGGQIFFFYGSELKNEATVNKDRTKSDAFVVDRVRINVSKEFDSIWSAFVTAEGNNTGAAHTTASFYVRNAYLSAKVGNDDAKVTLNGGVMTNPIHLVNDIQRGDRWINKEYYDNSNATGTTGVGLWNADYAIINGITVQADLMKMVTLRVAFANGGTNGASNLAGSNGTDNSTQFETAKNSGKAIIGHVTVTPIEGIFINGYVTSMEVQVKNTTKSEAGISQLNYGGGVGINLMGIRAGVNFAMLDNKTEPVSGTGFDIKGTLIDTYLNANLKEFVGMPVLVIGRFAYGVSKKDVSGTDLLKDSDVTVYGIGVGYQFNANVQAALYFENYTFKKTNPVIDAGEGARQTIYVKTEAKF